MKNQLKMSFDSLSENVGIARITAAAFSSQVDFTLSDIEEIKVAISEAVSNAVIHGYAETQGTIEMIMTLCDNYIEYVVSDRGAGIVDVNLARQPAYSSMPERMGLGFVFMESFMDELDVKSTVGSGTTVRMIKKFDAKPVH